MNEQKQEKDDLERRRTALMAAIHREESPQLVAELTEKLERVNEQIRAAEGSAK